MYNVYSIDEFGHIAISNTTSITSPEGTEILWQHVEQPMVDILDTADTINSESEITFYDAVHTTDIQATDIIAQLSDTIHTFDVTQLTSTIQLLLQQLTTNDANNLLPSILCHDMTTTTDQLNHHTSLWVYEHTASNDSSNIVPILTYFEHIVMSDIVTNTVNYMAVMFGNYSRAITLRKKL